MINWTCAYFNGKFRYRFLIVNVCQNVVIVVDCCLWLNFMFKHLYTVNILDCIQMWWEFLSIFKQQQQKYRIIDSQFEENMDNRCVCGAEKDLTIHCTLKEGANPFINFLTGRFHGTRPDIHLCYNCMKRLQEEHEEEEKKEAGTSGVQNAVSFVIIIGV